MYIHHTKPVLFARILIQEIFTINHSMVLIHIVHMQFPANG